MSDPVHDDESAPALRAKPLPRSLPLTADPPALVPARMINEVHYCERLMYLEWSQGEFADNAFTVDQLRHERLARWRIEGRYAAVQQRKHVDVPLLDEPEVVGFDEPLGTPTSTRATTFVAEGGLHPRDRQSDHHQGALALNRLL